MQRRVLTKFICDDFCLEPGKIDALKMLDLKTKSAIDQLNWPVLLKARNLASRITPEKENLTSNGYVY
jgi:hypothetical protein